MIDAFICSTAIVDGAVRRACDPSAASTWPGSRRRRRVLIVGAGRSGRSLLRELRETPGRARRRVRRRRPAAARPQAERRQGRRRALPARASLERLSPGRRPRDDPERPTRRARRPSCETCADDDVSCRFVRREVDLDPQVTMAPSRGDRRVIRVAAVVPRPAVAVYPLLLAYVLPADPLRVADDASTRPRGSSSTSCSGPASHARSPITGRRSSACTTSRFSSLYAYFLAPGVVARRDRAGYAAAKYLNVAVMTASLFPAYGLARLFVPRGAAIAVRRRDRRDPGARLHRAC